jgi:hypothetical protein
VLSKLAHHNWDRLCYNERKRRLRKAQQESEKAISGVLIDESEAKAKEMVEIIEMLLRQEEVKWLQRSRVN